MYTGLALKTSQQMTLGPQLQQAIRLLQLSAMELEAEVRQALETNVFLEGEPAPMESPLLLDALPRSAAAPALSRPEQSEGFEQASEPDSLQDHLLWQLGLARLSERDRLIGAVIVDAITPDGFLEDSLQVLLETLGSHAVTLDELEAVRARVLRLDPVGCGALSLQESLRVQLQALDTALDGATLQRAQALLAFDPQDLASRDWPRLAECLGCQPEEAKAALSLLSTLKPRPGAGRGGSAAQYIVPDVLVRRREGRWVVELNPDLLPRIQVNPHYEAMMGRHGLAAGHAAMQTQLQEARWLVKSLHMRNDTLLKVAGAIVRQQRQFLEHGEIGMRPMVLSDIAEAIEMHESTVSRVTTQKYIHTPRGLFELKYFFSSRLATRGGGRCSSTAVRALTRQLLENEDPRCPLSDGEIARLLAEQGVRIARRTVAKYRDLLGIPPLTERAGMAAGRCAA